jgi:hypothetical protein
MADAAEENLDLNVVLGGIAPRDRGGGKRRCRAGNGISFCVVHEVTSTSAEDVEHLARKSDYKTVPFERYPDPANLLPISVDA